MLLKNRAKPDVYENLNQLLLVVYGPWSMHMERLMYNTCSVILFHLGTSCNECEQCKQCSLDKLDLYKVVMSMC